MKVDKSLSLEKKFKALRHQRLGLKKNIHITMGLFNIFNFIFISSRINAN